jgi:hypothetical protein
VDRFLGKQKITIVGAARVRKEDKFVCSAHAAHIILSLDRAFRKNALRIGNGLPNQFIAEKE